MLTIISHVKYSGDQVLCLALLAEHAHEPEFLELAEHVNVLRRVALAAAAARGLSHELPEGTLFHDDAGRKSGLALIEILKVEAVDELGEGRHPPDLLIADQAAAQLVLRRLH